MTEDDMKKGDIITCASLKDLEKELEALSAAGFHGVRDSGKNFSIVITGVPETEYLKFYIFQVV